MATIGAPVGGAQGVEFGQALQVASAVWPGGRQPEAAGEGRASRRNSPANAASSRAGGTTMTSWPSP